MISVIIPTRNEARTLPRLVKRLHAMPQISQIIVSDGGSTDETPQIARELGVLVLEGARGRGAQQNLGALFASGEIVWFLHADARPSRGCGAQMLRARQNGALGGNFRIRFEARGFWPRLFELIARVQRKFGVYYGDSGIWVTRSAWDELGGFENWPLFEDLDLARKLEKLSVTRGQKTACCAGRLYISARRFQTAPLATLFLWIRLQIAFTRGASPQDLARRYYGGSQ